MDEFNGVTLQKYAELCALMADTGTDVAKQEAIAEANGVSKADWNAAKDGFTKKMMDPADMGKTAMAFMPLMQEAQAKARGGAEPCTLETYSKVHAAMAFRKDPSDPTKKIDHMVVLQEFGFTQPKWLECENYWTPIVAFDAKLPMEMQKRFDKEKSAKCDEIIKSEEKRILGIAA